jgi:ferric-dicitrate binding protein FerR (iron transport regulator)
MSQDLIAGWLAGTLTTQEEETFALRLRDEVTLQRALVRESHFQSALRRSVRDRVTRGELGFQAGEPSPHRTARRRPARRSRRIGVVVFGRWALAAAAVLVVVVGLVVMTATTNSPVLAVTSGTVTVDGRVREGQLRLVAGERIGVTSGSAELRLADGSVVDLSAGSTVVVGDGHERVLSLETGSIAAVVTPQVGERRFIIETPHFTTRVVGTAYTVRTFPDRTRLVVTEGVVAVRTRQGQERLIHAGDDFTRSEEVLGWRYHDSGDNVIRLRADHQLRRGGRATLALTYQPPTDAIGWDLVQRPFRIGQRTGVRVWVQVDAADERAKVNVQVVERDGDTWLLSSLRLEQQQLQTWIPLDVPLRTPLRLLWHAGDGTFDPEQVWAIRVAPNHTASRIHVDLPPD